MNDPYYIWDYGSVVPLRYLVPDEDIPVINLSVTLAASLEETYKWGQVISKVLRESEKKVVFLSSGALSHNLVRGRHNKPTVSEHALDKQFIEFVMKKDYKSAYDMLPQYARLARVESGGRHLAMLFTMIEDGCEPTYLAEGQSSGSWNAVAKNPLDPECLAKVPSTIDINFVSRQQTSGLPKLVKGSTIPEEVQPYVLESGEGIHLLSGDTVHSLLTTKAATDGQFLALVSEGPKGLPIGEHAHEFTNETLIERYILGIC